MRAWEGEGAQGDRATLGQAPQRGPCYREDLSPGLRSSEHVPGFEGNTSFPNFIPDSWDDKLGSYLGEKAGEGGGAGGP